MKTSRMMKFAKNNGNSLGESRVSKGSRRTQGKLLRFKFLEMLEDILSNFCAFHTFTSTRISFTFVRSHSHSCTLEMIIQISSSRVDTKYFFSTLSCDFETYLRQFSLEGNRCFLFLPYTKNTPLRLYGTRTVSFLYA